VFVHDFATSVGGGLDVFSLCCGQRHIALDYTHVFALVSMHKLRRHGVGAVSTKSPTGCKRSTTGTHARRATFGVPVVSKASVSHSLLN